jgi:phage FluMu protein Com
VGGKTKAADHGLRMLESVRCLECGNAYAKPSGGGTVETNPGCPECRYLGWLPFSPEAATPQLRSAGDHPRRRFA